MFLFVLLSVFLVFFFLQNANSRQSFFFVLYFFMILFTLAFVFKSIFFKDFFLRQTLYLFFLSFFFILIAVLVHEVFLTDKIVPWLFIFVLPLLFFSMLSIIQFMDLLSVFFFLEIQNIMIFGFICFRANILESYRETIRFFFFSTFLACFSMFGLSLIYFLTGTLDLVSLAQLLYFLKSDPIFLLGNFLFFVNFFFKLTFFPFYIWLIYIFQATSLVGVFMQLILVKFVVFFLLVTNLSFLFFFVEFLVLPFGLITLLLSIFSILYEYSVKGFFAFSSIIQTVLLTLLLISNSFDVFGNLFFCFTIYALNMFGIFILLILFERSGINHFSKVYNLFKTNSFVCFFFFLFLFSLAGIPPFPGFFQKYLILKTLFLMDFVFAFVFILLCSLVIGFYYMRFVILLIGTRTECLQYSLWISSFSLRSLEFLVYLHILSVFFLYDFFEWCSFFSLNFSPVLI